MTKKKPKNFNNEERKLLEKSSGHLAGPGLEKLQQEFQKFLPRQLNALNEKYDNLCKTVTKDAFNSLKSEVHSIGNEATAYGYLQVKDLCNQFEEDILQKIKDFPKAAKEKEWVQEYERSLNRIKECFNGKEKKELKR